ncbi:uncharacterized protein LOC103703152 isoform X1 [Phoenix dactylifera]|uniref:Uncharacterized protein LOC103703152 isoform X1 n=2 Tax=Phoenix dactylifera TaxID=42345 RepID=A0A8B7BRW4_PHODC|nr:uncharacterized protein LOC103703152 isoform X1 [Phoenix dactylifera]
MRTMETLQDLIEEAKVRTVFWAICVFAISYFLSHTSKSMWTNIPISILILSVFRFLSYEVELRWRLRPAHKQTYLSHLEKKQLSLDDFRLSTVPPFSKWRRKIDSPTVEAAMEEFINRILQDFIVDLWYSSITPDKDAPELMRTIILDALGEISGRVKKINLLDLLTRDMVDLIGNQLDLYRKYQSEIGVDVMGTLSFEERDERLKCHLIASKELHPALLSPECEHQVLQRIVGGVLTIVLRPQEAQCPLVRCLSRELLTCLVLQPVMNLASPGYINELIEYIFLTNKDNRIGEADSDRLTNEAILAHDNNVSGGNTRTAQPESRTAASSQSGDLIMAKSGVEKSLASSEHGHLKTLQESSEHHIQPYAAEWAMILDAATKRRSQVLAPENLENMWTKGRNYKKKAATLMKAGTSLESPSAVPGNVDSTVHAGNTGKGLLTNMNESTISIDDKYMVHLMQGSNNNSRSSVAPNHEQHVSQDLVSMQSKEGGHFGDGSDENARKIFESNKDQLKRSSSTPDIETTLMGRSGESETTGFKENYSQNFSKHKQKQSSELVSKNEGSFYAPKIRCRVVGAYFEKLGSKSFAVYSIAVTDAENKTWFVKRRYRNFERLHRHLKDIPNYTLHLPPKRFLSSSIDDYFVHQRCILLDKYLQDLLSIANVAEQHEVWDFLSDTSKNYSFGKSTSVMKTLAVNVDDAVDDIVRQFKGVSDGLRRVVGSSPSHATSPPRAEKNMALPWNEEVTNKLYPGYSNVDTSQSLSDDEAHDEDRSSAVNNGWHSDNELNSKVFPPRVVKRIEESSNLDSQRSQRSDKFDRLALNASKTSVASELFEDPVGMPPEWTPPNVSVPLLNLVDKIFQLKRRGWLRRQVFWISKQILQLIMEDAIDDWILRQISFLRRDDVIAQGIRWVQDILWPNGTFFLKLERSQRNMDDSHFSQQPTQNTSQIYGNKVTRPSSFELQLEAARRASDVKKMILGGAPTALVSLIGRSQYRRCAKDVYYFIQSTVCVKQLAYSMLELVLVSVFPELRDLILDIHLKARNQPCL